MLFVWPHFGSSQQHMDQNKAKCKHCWGNSSCGSTKRGGLVCVVMSDGEREMVYLCEPCMFSESASTCYSSLRAKQSLCVHVYQQLSLVSLHKTFSRLNTKPKKGTFFIVTRCETEPILLVFMCLLMDLQVSCTN